jgi:inorganic pyrophosphatase
MIISPSMVSVIAAEGHDHHRVFTVFAQRIGGSQDSVTTVCFRLFSNLWRSGTVAKSKQRKSVDPTRLPPFDRKKPGTIKAVIETPGGSRNKFKYDETLGFYALSGVLPEGMVFPHAFGFVPGTKAADGDPEDILIIMDEPTFTGCVVLTRLLGVLEAEQTEHGETERNDRLIAVAAESRDYSDAKSLDDLNSNMLKEIKQFFITYNKEKGKKFRVLRMRGPKQALKLVKKSLQ